MSLLLESDIIYNILLHANLQTIGNIFCVNKIIHKLCCDKYFWKSKIENDYKNVIPKSNDWIYEYKCIYTSYVRALKFVEYLIVNGNKIQQHNSPAHSLFIKKFVNISYLRWSQTSLPLSPDMKKIMTSVSLVPNDVNLVCVTFYIFSDQLYLGPVIREEFSIDIFTNYITSICYDYGDIDIHNFLNKNIFSF